MTLPPAAINALVRLKEAMLLRQEPAGERKEEIEPTAQVSEKLRADRLRSGVVMRHARRRGDRWQSFNRSMRERAARTT